MGRGPVTSPEDDAQQGGLAGWLLGASDLPAPVRLALLKSLYGTLAIYVGGVVTTLSVAVILAIRIGTPAFYFWAAFELVISVVRFQVMRECRRAIRNGRPGPFATYAILSLLWAAGIGFGSFIALLSGDWIAAIVACVSSAAMLGGICFRYFALPRLAAAMLMAMGLPMVVACLMSGEPVLLIAVIEIPLYIVAMSSGARIMKRMMVRALCAELDESRRARHDPLTGLLNRAGLAEAYAERAANAPLTCYFVDLDGFKGVNDRLGHAAGDRLLAMIADRLRAAALPGDIHARLGGDEFLIVTPGRGRDAARAGGQAIAQIVADQPYLVEGQGVFIGASVGAALRPDHAESLDDLIAAADIALYEAKVCPDTACVVSGDRREAAEKAPALPPLRLAHG